MSWGLAHCGHGTHTSLGLGGFLVHQSSLTSHTQAGVGEAQICKGMDGEAWQATVHGVTKSQTQLSDFTFTFHVHALEKELATHSSILAWRIPGTEEPRWLPSMGSYRVGHD